MRNMASAFVLMVHWGHRVEKIIPFLECKRVFQKYCSLQNNYHALIFSEFNVPELMEDPVVKDIAKKHNKTAGQILLKFLVQQDVIVIPKSTNPERLKQNIDVIICKFFLDTNYILI